MALSGIQIPSAKNHPCTPAPELVPSSPQQTVQHDPDFATHLQQHRTAHLSWPLSQQPLRPTVPCRAAAALGALLALGLSACAGPAAPPEPPPARVEVAALRTGSAAPSIWATGTVMAVETSRVASGAEGKVVAYPFRLGARVQADEVLCQLRDVTLSIELEAARQLLLQREQEFAELARGFRAEEVAAALSRMRAMEAKSQLAAAHAQRMQELAEHPGQPVSQQELDDARFGAEQARNEWQAAQAEYQLRQNGPRPEQIAAAEAAVAVQRQELARLEDELGKRTVRAPFTGYLVEKSTDVGEWVPLGGAVATLVQLDEVEVRVNVEESFVQEIRPGQTVPVEIPALSRPDAQVATFEGTVQALVPRSQWQQGSRSFPVIVRVKNRLDDQHPLLQEGMVARIRFAGRARSTLFAPKDAIVRTSGRPQLFIIGPDRRARAVDVVEGLAQDAWVEVRGAFHAGDLVVTAGAERLRPLVAVAFDPPAATPPAVMAEHKQPPSAPTPPAQDSTSGEPRDAAGGR